MNVCFDASLFQFQELHAMHYQSCLTMASRSQYRISISLRTPLRINATLDIKLMEAMTKCKSYNVRPVEIGTTIWTEEVQCFHVPVRSNLPTSLKLFNFLVTLFVSANTVMEHSHCPTLRQRPTQILIKWA